MSIADLLEDYFESPQMLGVLSVSGVIGTWAGPRSPGTAFVMAHHKVGDVGDGELGSWGFPRGGMGGLSAAIAAAARSFGAEIRTDAPVSRIVARRRARRTAWSRRRERSSPHPSSSRPCTRRSPSSISSTVSELPAEFVRDISRWNTRSGTVKINLAVDRLPEFTAKPGFDPEVHGGTIVLARSLDEVETRVSRRGRRAGGSRDRSPTSASRRCSTRRWRPRAITSCRCSPSGCRTSGPTSRCRPSSTRTRIA